MNGELIARRRLLLALSRSDVARQTGMSWDLIASLEGGHEPQAITLDAVRRLAGCLGVDLNALVKRSTSQQEDVVRRLEALLTHARRPHTPDELGRAAGLSIDTITTALHELERRLTDTGQALHHHEGRVEIVARGDRLRPDDIAQLRRAHDPLGVAEATLLRRIAIGRLRDRRWETLDEPDRRLLARLGDHGLVEPATDHVRLTAHAHASLEPELRPGPYGVRWPLEQRRARSAAS